MADFLRSTSSAQGMTQRSVQQPGALQLHEIPSLTEMARTDRPEAVVAQQQLSSRSHASQTAVSASPEEITNLQQLLNKCEVELEAKNHMVTARDAQITEFKQTIELLQEQITSLNKAVDVDTNAQREEMRAELEALK